MKLGQMQVHVNEEKRPLREEIYLQYQMPYFNFHVMGTDDCPLGLSLMYPCFLNCWFLNLTFKSQSQKKNDVNMLGIVVAWLMEM